MAVAQPVHPKQLDKNFLADPKNLEFFTKFLESEHNNENLLFWMDVERYKQIEDQQVLEKEAKALFHRYISADADFMVNLTYRVAKEITDRVEANNIDSNLYNEAQDNIFYLMKNDPFPRFLKSAAYAMLASKNHTGGPRKASGTTTNSLADLVLTEFLKAAEGTDGWGDVKEKDGVLVSRKKYQGSEIYCLRGIGVIQAPAIAIYDLVRDINRRKKWDEMFLEGKEIEQLADTVLVQYMAWQSPSKLTKSRDFVVLRVERITEDGVCTVNTRSVVHKDAPPRRGFIRGELESSGFIVRPLPHNKDASLVTYVAQIDPKGKIPSSVEALVSVKRPLCISKIRNLILHGVEAQVTPHFLKKVAEEENSLNENQQEQDQEQQSPVNNTQNSNNNNNNTSPTNNTNPHTFSSSPIVYLIPANANEESFDEPPSVPVSRTPPQQQTGWIKARGPTKVARPTGSFANRRFTDVSSNRLETISNENAKLKNRPSSDHVDYFKVDPINKDCNTNHNHSNENSGSDNDNNSDNNNNNNNEGGGDFINTASEQTCITKEIHNN